MWINKAFSFKRDFMQSEFLANELSEILVNKKQKYKNNRKKYYSSKKIYSDNIDITNGGVYSLQIDLQSIKLYKAEYVETKNAELNKFGSAYKTLIDVISI